LADDGLQKISGQFYFVLFSDALMLLGLWLFLRARRNGFGQLGFGRKPAVRDAGYALAGYAVYFIAFFVVAAFIVPMIGINTEQRQELGFDNLFTQAEKIMGLVALVLLPPFIEETIFRGFLFTGLRKKMTFVWVAVITSAFFASPHLLASSHGLLWVAGIDTFILSLVLCYLRERTGALWAPIAVHAIKNAIAFSLLLSGAA
jgi:membrane protease YdiL (CAAX protease family)